MPNMEAVDRVIGHIKSLEHTSVVVAAQGTVRAYCNMGDSYNMSQWAVRTECGTSSCLAGWAVALYRPEQYAEYLNYTGNIGEAARRAWTFTDLARDIFDITSTNADVMFYQMNATADDHYRVFKALEENPELSRHDIEVFYDES